MTHAQLLAGFFILTAEITIHLVRFVFESPEGAVLIAVVATGVAG